MFVNTFLNFFRRKKVRVESLCTVETADISDFSQNNGAHDWFQRFKVHSYSLVKREQINCHNLLNRMQEHEGWLTHLPPGVVSQLEIPLANHLQYKRKVKAVKTLTYILRIGSGSVK